MRPRRASRLAAIAAVILGLGLIGASQATAGSLSVTVYKQEQSQWCWAASSKTVLQYFKRSSPTQCTLVKNGFKSTSCANNPGSFITQLDNLYSANNLNSGNIVYSMPSFTSIKYDIDQSRLMQIRYGYKSTNLSTGHIVTLRGYSGTSTVYWSDPASGTNKSGTHAYLSDNASWKTTHGRYQMG